MARRKPREVPLPKKLDDLVEFFETHDMSKKLEIESQTKLKAKDVTCLERCRWRRISCSSSQLGSPISTPIL
jgi:hypothetical protein